MEDNRMGHKVSQWAEWHSFPDEDRTEFSPSQPIWSRKLLGE